MNQASSAPGASLLPDSTDLFTAAHLAIVLLFALLVIAGMIWGARLKRGRKAALREIGEHNEEVQQEQPAGERDRPAAEPAPAPPADAANPSASAPPPTSPAPPPVSPAPGNASGSEAGADGPVTQLKGLGPKLADRLRELGVTTVGQIAALTDDEAAALDARLGPFSGRMARDRWQEQARFLAAGDQAGFEAVFGRL